jgi:hypothetical protein
LYQTAAPNQDRWASFWPSTSPRPPFTPRSRFRVLPVPS